MLAQITNLLEVAGILLVSIAAWFVTIAVVYRDIHRRRMGGLEQFLWLAAVVLLPLVGFLIYWAARLLTRLLMSEPLLEEDPRLRMTAARPAVRAQGDHFQTMPGQEPMPNQPQAGFGAPPAPGGNGAPRLNLALSVTEGPYKGGKFLINQLPARIGRGSWATVQLNEDQGVSRQHAEIYSDPGGGLIIRDLGSTHGTYVNGARVSQTRIKAGDHITLGQSNFIVSENRG